VRCSRQREVDEGDVDTLPPRQFDAPGAGDGAVAVGLGDVARDEAGRLAEGDAPVGGTLRTVGSKDCSTKMVYLFFVFGIILNLYT